MRRGGGLSGDDTRVSVHGDPTRCEDRTMSFAGGA
jgi:hypothetical protein